MLYIKRGTITCEVEGRLTTSVVWLEKTSTGVCIQDDEAEKKGEIECPWGDIRDLQIYPAAIPWNIFGQAE